MNETQFVNRNKLRGAIAEHGLTQGKVAAKLNISIQSLSTKMQGKYAFTENEIVALRDLFGLDIFILQKHANKMKAELQAKYQMLTSVSWTYKDIMSYFPHIKSKTTAIKIKNRAIDECNGKVKFGDHLVLADSVLKLMGTSREQEIEIIAKAIKELGNETL